MTILRLIRFTNAIIIGLTQGLLYYQFLYKTAFFYGLELTLDIKTMVVLSLCTILVLAGGNIYNDLQDVEADLLNRPDKVIIGSRMDPTIGWSLYIGSVVMSVTLAIWLSIGLSNPWCLIVVLFCILSLYAYSKWLRSFPLLGNLVVALMCSLSILIIPVAARADLLLWLRLDPLLVFHCLTLFGIFALFAFLANFIREVIKDMEDRKGDQVMGWKSIAILWPDNQVKLLLLLVFSTVLVLIVTILLLLPENLGRYGITYGTGLILVTIHQMYHVAVARNVNDYRRLNRWLKMYLVLGLLFVIFWHV